MVNVQCPIEGCDFQTGEYAASIVAALLACHTQGYHTNAPAATAARPRLPKVDRPILTDDMDEESWNVFQLSWDIYAKAHDIPDADVAVQLYQCCSNTLKQKITSVHHDFLMQHVDRLLPLLKTSTVTPVAISVKRNEFLQLKLLIHIHFSH